MKKIVLIFFTIFSLYAADYSSMSMEELQAARGSVGETDRDAFKSEMQSRMQSLNPQEREDARSSMRQSDSSSQMRRGSGSTNGSMSRYRRGR